MSRAVFRDDAKTELEYSVETKQSLYSMFNYGVEHAGRKAVAIQYFDNRISYGELYDLVNICAAGFLEHGVKKRRLCHRFSPEYPAVRHCSLRSQQDRCDMQYGPPSLALIRARECSQTHGK